MTGADARLHDIAAQHGLSDHTVAVLRAVLAFQASDEHAPTTVWAVEAAADRHVADSLVALELPEVRLARRIADLGAGAGWPGLALAAALPESRISLVESAQRRCRYLGRLVDAVALDNVEVVHARAETWPAGLGVHDLVTARALAELSVAAEYAAPLLAEGGTLVAWKGMVGRDELAAARSAAETLGLLPLPVADVRPYPGAGPATLHRFRKVAPTPDRFPRRPGIAVKRPLPR